MDFNLWMVLLCVCVSCGGKTDVFVVLVLFISSFLGEIREVVLQVRLLLVVILILGAAYSVCLCSA